MKNFCFIMLLISCLSVFPLTATNANSENTGARPPVSEETEMCLECHISYSPGIVEDWLKSRHAAATPMDAIEKPESERRVSAQTFPESVGPVAVGCYECHGLNADAHDDNFEHVGMSINIVVSPNDCKTCHPVEVDQYMDSKKAHAVGTLRKNPVYTALVETVIGLKEAKDGKSSVLRLPIPPSRRHVTPVMEPRSRWRGCELFPLMWVTWSFLSSAIGRIRASGVSIPMAVADHVPRVIPDITSPLR